MILFVFGIDANCLLILQEENLDAKIDALLNVEKQMRLAGDVAGTKKAVIEIVELCYKAGAWKTLNDQIVLIAKRRGQLKQVVPLERSCLICFVPGFELL